MSTDDQHPRHYYDWVPGMIRRWRWLIRFNVVFIVVFFTIGIYFISRGVWLLAIWFYLYIPLCLSTVRSGIHRQAELTELHERAQRGEWP